MSETTGEAVAAEARHGFNRRQMVGMLVAAPTLAAGVTLGSAPAASGQNITVNPTDVYDLSDLLRDAAMATNILIQITVNSDGTVGLDLPRSENGQGITTSMPMIVADELGVPLSSVKCTLADARSELVFNQFTGGSVSTFELYEPLRQAAALARGRLRQAAAARFGVAKSQVTLSDGVLRGGGQSVTIGEMARTAAIPRNHTASEKVELRAAGEGKLVGTEVPRTDARAAVTGSKVFTMDIDVPNALPTMLCRPPTLNGSAEDLINFDEIKKMPGVTDVVVIPNTSAAPNINGLIAGGVAVRAETFGQCLDAIGRMKVKWKDGSAAGMSDADVLKDLRANELPLTPALPGKVLEEEFIFHFRPGDPLETNCAIADVRPDRAEIWGPLKTPVWCKERLSSSLKIALDKVVVHVTEGGGSFGRHLFNDAAFEAAWVSRAMGHKPVKLMWSRADGPRQGRQHPMQLSRIRIVHDGSKPSALDQRFTSVATDFTHGLSNVLTAVGATPPAQNHLQYSQTVWNLTANVPYNFGIVTQLINEIYPYNKFNTSSVRNIYGPSMRTSLEIMTDKMAEVTGMDPFDFRQKFARFDRHKAVLERLRKESEWGRRLPAGVAQGVAIHNEYKGFAGCVIEIDTRQRTVNRRITGAVTGPRVTRATFVVDVGLPINRLGLKAQMMGGVHDGISQALTYSSHLKDGRFLEASWDNSFYARHWNSPPRLDVIVMDPTTGKPGGAGELGVAASMAATACAYGRAVGKYPTSFPINHNKLAFKPYPFEPSVPPSPKNGLKYRNAPKQR